MRIGLRGGNWGSSSSPLVAARDSRIYPLLGAQRPPELHEPVQEYPTVGANLLTAPFACLQGPAAYAEVHAGFASRSAQIGPPAQRGVEWLEHATVARRGIVEKVVDSRNWRVWPSESGEAERWGSPRGDHGCGGGGEPQGCSQESEPIERLQGATSEVRTQERHRTERYGVG